MIFVAAVAAGALQAQAEPMSPSLYLGLLNGLEERVARASDLDQRKLMRISADLNRHSNAADNVAWVGNEERREDARRICGLAVANLHSLFRQVYILRDGGDPRPTLGFYQKSKAVCVRKAGVTVY